MYMYTFVYYMYMYMCLHIHIYNICIILILIYTYVEVSNHSEVPTRQPPGKPFKSSLSCKMKKRRSETEKIWNATTALNPFRSPHHSNHLYNKNKNPSQKSSKRKKKNVPTHQSNFMRFLGGTNRNFIETKPTDTPIDSTVALGPSTFNCTKEEQITRRTWRNQRKRWVARGRNPKEEDGGMLDLHRYVHIIIYMCVSIYIYCICFGLLMWCIISQKIENHSYV